ncbi:MAG: alkaline phosphatase family protein [Nanoarchaeota archaeon]
MAKLIIIGLDGVGPDLIEKLDKENRIPYIKKIIQGGFLKSLESVLLPVTIPAWPCMVSGQNPGEIGSFSLFAKEGYTSRVKTVTNCTPFWEKLNLKVGLLNIPGTYPVKPVKGGFMMSCMFTPSGAKEFIYPPELKDELKEELKNFEFALAWNNEDDLIQRATNLTSLRFKILEKLYFKYQPEICMVVENNTDILQHYLIKYFDENSPLYKENKYKEKVYTYFEHLDSLIGRFTQKIDDAIILIVSDHGQVSLKGNICLNHWLEEKGYLVLKKRKKRSFLSQFFLKIKIDETKIEKLLKRLKIRRLVYRWLWGSGLGKFFINEGGLTWSIAVEEDIIDFSMTKAFSAVGQGFIYINDRSEEKGIVSDHDYEKVRARLIKNLKNLKIVGAKIAVKKREEVFQGKQIHEAPDLLVYDENFSYWPITVVGSSKLIQEIGPDFPRPGDHHIKGILISNKKSLEKESFKIQDVHSIVMDIFKDKIKEGSKIKEGKDQPFTFNNEEEIKKRLERLGYFS